MLSRYPGESPSPLTILIPVSQYVRMSNEHQHYPIENQKAAIQEYAMVRGASRGVAGRGAGASESKGGAPIILSLMIEPKHILYRGVPMIEGWPEKTEAAQNVFVHA
jgi:hypothetical protein